MLYSPLFGIINFISGMMMESYVCIVNTGLNINTEDTVLYTRSLFCHNVNIMGRQTFRLLNFIRSP